MPLEKIRGDKVFNGLAVADADEGLMEAFLRLMKLLDTPDDIPQTLPQNNVGKPHSIPEESAPARNPPNNDFRQRNRCKRRTQWATKAARSSAANTNASSAIRPNAMSQF